MTARAYRAKLRDTSGASIVIALVFFLICAIIGSVVLTAASVQAKAMATHRETQQAEFSVGSAAQLLGVELNLPVEVTRDTQGSIVKVKPDGEGVSNPFGNNFWTKYGLDIVKGFGKSEFKLTGLTVTQANTDALAGGSVSGTITVTKDLDVDIDLTFNKQNDPEALYQMHVYLQCIPTFDVEGNLLSFAYEDAVITKGTGRS